MKTETPRRRISEASLVARAADLLRAQGAEIHFEVPSLGQSVDLVAEQDDSYLAVEAKVADWRRALRQAMPHLLVADYVAIAVSYNEVPTKLIEEAETLGIGVINWKLKVDSIGWELQARKSERVWQPQKDIFRKSVRGTRHVG